MPANDAGPLEGCVRLLVRPAPAPCPVWSDNDELSFTATPILDDEVWIDARPQLVVRPPVVFVDNDEAWPLGGFRVDEEYWLDPGRQPLVRNAQPITDNDEAAPLGGFRVDEEYAWPVIQSRLPGTTQPVLDADELPIAPSTFGLEEDQCQSLRGQSLPSSLQVFLDNDEAAPLGGFRLDDEYWQPPVCFPYTVARQPVWGDEEWVPSSAGFGLDDDIWTYATQRQYNARPQVFTDADEYVPTIDEDVWVYGTQRLYAPPLQAITDGDERVAPPPPFGLDDDPWMWLLLRTQYLYPVAPQPSLEAELDLRIAVGEPYREFTAAGRVESFDATDRVVTLTPAYRPFSFEVQK